MDRKLTVVTSEGEVFVEQSTNPEIRHQHLCKKVMKQRDLQFEGDSDLLAHQLCLYLTLFGDLVISHENGFNVFYLGEFLTQEQVSWFQKEKKNIRHEKTSIVEFVNFSSTYYDKFHFPNENLFSRLCSLVKEKEVDFTPRYMGKESAKICIKN